MDVAAELKLPPWMEPAALTGFLDELRESGYNVGTAQYISAQDLVLALAARGEDLASPARFRSFLGPLVCRSPREQEEFRGVFDRWVSRFEAGAGDGATERRASEEEVYGELRKVGRRSRLWKYWIGLLALVLVGLFLYFKVPRSGSVAPPTEPIAQETLQTKPPVWEAREIAAGFLGVLLLTLVAWRLWWRHRAHLFLVRLATTNNPRIERLPVQVRVDELFEKHFLLRTIQGFRQRFEVPSSDLDVEGTIHATVRNGGWLKPAFGKRGITPEYLVLIDRASHRDQQARLIEEMVAQLEKSHVFVSRYYFDGDPRLCFPSSERELPLNLAELRTRYPEHRLLLFTDALGLFDFGVGELAPWVEQLAQWRQRALLTPQPMAEWRQRELTIRSQLMVLPATAEGLAHLSRIFNSEKPHALQSAVTPSLMPEDLHLRPQRWLSRDAPEERLVERVLGDLEQFLGDAGFYWLSACAVYPELSWDLALFLGNELRTEEGERLLTTDRLAALGQLPWFRNGSMPDWLRLRLVGGMPRERERAVRALLTNLLLTTLSGVRHDFYLEIAQRERRTLSRLMRQALDVLAHRSPEESPLKDHVFRDFMAGRRPRRLAVRLPEQIAALFAAGKGRSAVHARVRRTERMLLPAGLVVLILSVMLGAKDRLIISMLGACTVIPLLLLGLIYKRSRLAGVGTLAMLPIAGLSWYISWRDSQVIRYVFIVVCLLILLGACFYIWRGSERELPTVKWRSAAFLFTAVLAWAASSLFTYFLDGWLTTRTSSLDEWGMMSFVIWPGLAFTLVVGGYIEKSIWLASGGMTQVLELFIYILFYDSRGTKGDRLVFGVSLAVSLATILIFLVQVMRRSAKLTGERRGALT